MYGYGKVVTPGAWITISGRVVNLAARTASSCGERACDFVIMAADAGLVLEAYVRLAA